MEDGLLREGVVRQASVPVAMRGVQREAANLADALRERIRSGHLDVGSRLGSEQELIRWSGRSRATVREALRLLAEHGIVTTRPGPKGGVFVATPGPERMARSLGILLETSRVSLAELFEARIEIESVAAGVAARRRTAEDLRGIERSCDDLERFALAGDSEAAVEENLAFHAALVAAGHNTVLTVLHGALRDLVRASTLEPVYGPQVQQEVAWAHRRIVEALRQQDSEATVRRLRRHLAAFEHHLRRSGQYALLQRRFRL